MFSSKRPACATSRRDAAKKEKGCGSPVCIRPVTNAPSAPSAAAARSTTSRWNAASWPRGNATSELTISAYGARTRHAYRSIRFHACAQPMLRASEKT
eukprot:4343158-Prymnesium_polylepis.1